jgi:hypothetical protein
LRKHKELDEAAYKYDINDLLKSGSLWVSF